MKENIFILIMFVFLISAAIMTRINNVILNVAGIVLFILSIILIAYLLKKNKKR